MNDPAVGAIDHVAIVVADADAAAGKLVELLGYLLAGDEVVAAAGVRLVYLADPGGGGGTQLQLVQPVEDGPVARFLTERGEGLHHVCFRTNDVHQALRDAQHHERGVFTGGRGQPCAFLDTEPHGLRIELTELGTAYQDAAQPHGRDKR